MENKKEKKIVTKKGNKKIEDIKENTIEIKITEDAKMDDNKTDDPINELNQPRYEVCEKQEDGSWSEPVKFVTQTQISAKYGLTRHICLNLIRGQKSSHGEKLKITKIGGILPNPKVLSRPVGAIQTFDNYKVSKCENEIWGDYKPYRTLTEISKELKIPKVTLYKIIAGTSKKYINLYKIESLNSSAEDVLKQHQQELELNRQRREKINLFKEKCKPYEEELKNLKSELAEKHQIVKDARKIIVQDRAKVFEIIQKVKSS